jgi:BASS family bile acid:Na+ symporter
VTIAYLQKLADFSMLAYVIGTMLAMGMSQRLQDVIAPLKKPLPVALALLVNFLLAPLLAIALSHMIPLQPDHAIGLLLLGAAAGGPFLPKLAEIAGGSLAYSVALMVLLTAGTIVFMPLALAHIVPGLHADALSIAKPLLILMLLPLAIGFALARTDASWVAGLLALVRAVSNSAFVLLVILMIGLNFKALVDMLGSFAIGAYPLFVLIMVGGSYVLSGLEKSTRTVFALGAGQRNAAAALVVAGASFDDPAVTVTLLVASIVSLIVLLALAKVMQRRQQ